MKEYVADLIPSCINSFGTRERLSDSWRAYLLSTTAPQPHGVHYVKVAMSCQKQLHDKIDCIIG